MRLDHMQCAGDTSVAAVATHILVNCSSSMASLSVQCRVAVASIRVCQYCTTQGKRCTGAVMRMCNTFPVGMSHEFQHQDVLQVVCTILQHVLSI